MFGGDAELVVKTPDHGAGEASLAGLNLEDAGAGPARVDFRSLHRVLLLRAELDRFDRIVANLPENARFRRRRSGSPKCRACHHRA